VVKHSDIHANEKVVPYKMIIELRYKVTTNKWIGEWVLVE